MYSPIVLVALIKIITLLVLNSFHEGFCFVDVKDVLITKYSNNSVMWANVVIGSVVVVLLSMAVYCNKSMRPMPIRTIQTNGWDKRLSTQALFFAFSFVLCLFFVVHFFDINLDSHSTQKLPIEFLPGFEPELFLVAQLLVATDSLVRGSRSRIMQPSRLASIPHAMHISPQYV